MSQSTGTISADSLLVAATDPVQAEGLFFTVAELRDSMFPVGYMTPADQLNAAAAAAAQATANAAIPISTLGQPLGPVQSDATNKVPIANLPSAVLGSSHFLGVWNASTNTPLIVSGTPPDAPSPVGGYYVVSVAGTQTIDGNSVWNAGDWIIWNGTTWDNISGQVNPVSSVAGLQGAVTASQLAAALVGTVGLTVADGQLNVLLGTTGNSAAAGDDARITGALQGANNLSDLESNATARGNLGLTNVAISSFNTAGGPLQLDINSNISGQTLAINASAFETIEELLSNPALTASPITLADQQTMKVAQYLNPADLGGGEFKYVACATAPHDFGINFVPQANLTAVTSSVPVGTADGSQTVALSFTQLPLQPGTISIFVNGVAIGDDGAGHLTGAGVLSAGLSGTAGSIINYATGLGSLTLATAMTAGLTIRATFSFASSPGRIIRQGVTAILPEYFGAQGGAALSSSNVLSYSYNDTQALQRWAYYLRNTGGMGQFQQSYFVNDSIDLTNSRTLTTNPAATTQAQYNLRGNALGTGGIYATITNGYPILDLSGQSYFTHADFFVISAGPGPNECAAIYHGSHNDEAGSGGGGTFRNITAIGGSVAGGAALAIYNNDLDRIQIPILHSPKGNALFVGSVLSYASISPTASLIPAGGWPAASSPLISKYVTCSSVFNTTYVYVEGGTFNSQNTASSTNGAPMAFWGVRGISLSNCFIWPNTNGNASVIDIVDTANTQNIHLNATGLRVEVYGTTLATCVFNIIETQTVSQQNGALATIGSAVISGVFPGSTTALFGGTGSIASVEYVGLNAAGIFAGLTSARNCRFKSNSGSSGGMIGDFLVAGWLPDTVYGSAPSASVPNYCAANGNIYRCLGSTAYNAGGTSGTAPPLGYCGQSSVITGTVSGSVLTVSGQAVNPILVGGTVMGLSPTTVISSFGSGTGGTGTYHLSTSGASGTPTSIAYNITSLTWSAGVVKATIPATSLPVGWSFYSTISGVVPAAYNGTYLIQITSSTTFTYALAANPGPETAAGTYSPPVSDGGLLWSYVSPAYSEDLNFNGQWSNAGYFATYNFPFLPGGTFFGDQSPYVNKNRIISYHQGNDNAYGSVGTAVASLSAVYPTYAGGSGYQSVYSVEIPAGLLNFKDSIGLFPNPEIRAEFRILINNGLPSGSYAQLALAQAGSIGSTVTLTTGALGSTVQELKCAVSIFNTAYPNALESYMEIDSATTAAGGAAPVRCAQENNLTTANGFSVNNGPITLTVLFDSALSAPIARIRGTVIAY